MNTIHLSDEVVMGYLMDLWERLAALEGGVPMIWCPIGPSGVRLAQAAMRVAGDLVDQIKHVPIVYNRGDDTILFPREPHPASIIQGTRILLLDGSVHSGNTLWKAYLAVEALQPKEISTYSLIVRVGSSIIPNHFGLMIGDYDRAFFLRKTFPNNRLFTCGCVRELEDTDQAKSKPVCGETCIDKFSWGDLLYEMRTDPHRKTYVYERQGRIMGYVNFRITPGEAIFVDVVAVDRSCQKQDIGGSLMRWTETCGRNCHCGTIHLWAIDDRKPWYSRKLGYSCYDKPHVLDGTTFHPMRKKLLYNLPDDDSPATRS